MFSWIWNNKEWLFSGIGVVALVFLFQLVSRYRKRRRLRALPAKGRSLPVIIETQPVKSPEKDKAPTPSPLTAHTIMTNIKSAPILQQPDIIKNYLGLRVSWEGFLSGAWEKATDLFYLHIFIPRKDEDHQFVLVVVAPSQNPGLGLLKKGHPIRVSGVISDIKDYFIFEDVQIKYELGSLNK